MVHSVPRRQGRRPTGINFVHFSLKSLFSSELLACIKIFIVSIPSEKEREIIMRILFCCCSKRIRLSINDDMRNLIRRDKA